ncbi:MAG: porin, partial [Myxococcota bacterium]
LNAIMVGHFKEPLSLQEATSSKYMTFMERGLTSAFFPGRNVGIMVDGNSAEHRVFWQIGAFRETNDQGQGFDSWGEQRWDVAGRLAVTPVYSETGDHVLHLGVGYVHRFLSGNRSDERLRLRARPVAHLAQYFADTESLAAFQADIVNFELAYVRGGFSFQAELTKTWIEGAGGLDDLEFRSAYAFASYFLTGEQREYLLGKGKFGRVKPIHDFDPSRGHWGALEVALRYSYLDLVDHSIDGGELWEVTAGLNWYLFPNVRWMLNYVHTEVEDRFATPTGSLSGAIDGAAEVVEMRIQLDF